MNVSIPTTPPTASVNRVRIIDLPGLPIDAEVRGRSAYELLSTPAVIRYARARADALQLPAAFALDTPETRLALPPFVDRCLSSPDAAARAAAQAIGARLGRNLGHILLTLRRGDAVNRAARADWTAADWSRWGQIEQVWLGGGLMCGRLGALMVEHARAFLAESGCAGQPRVGPADIPGDMPILGAARYLPAGAPHALCLDFGHTQVKRACLTFEGETLVRLHRYSPRPTALDWLGAAQQPNPSMGRQVLSWMADTITKTWLDQAHSGRRVSRPGADVMLSVAAYVEDGKLLGNGLYANLSTLADDVRPLLAGAIAERLGRAVRVHLVHDGTAASALYAGAADTAIILVGTALGVGFPPASADGLRRLSSNLKMETTEDKPCRGAFFYS